jgi:hypothetical protein
MLLNALVPFPEARIDAFSQNPEPESEMSSSTFRDFFQLGAGVTPAEGSVKPTAGFTYN